MNKFELKRCELMLLHLLGIDFSIGYTQDDIDHAIDQNKALWHKICTMKEVIK